MEHEDIIRAVTRALEKTPEGLTWLDLVVEISANTADERGDLAEALSKLMAEERVHRRGNSKDDRRFVLSADPEPQPTVEKGTGKLKRARPVPVPCPHCKGMYSPQGLWKHILYCEANPANAKDGIVLIDLDKVRCKTAPPLVYKENAKEPVRLRKSPIEPCVMTEEKVRRISEGHEVMKAAVSGTVPEVEYNLVNSFELKDVPDNIKQALKKDGATLRVEVEPVEMKGKRILKARVTQMTLELDIGD